MSVVVKVPTPLRKLAGGQGTVLASGSNLLECIQALEASYPGMKDRLCDDGGDIRRFVNIYVNGEDVRFLRGLGTPLKDGDEVSIVPAVAGGAAVMSWPAMRGVAGLFPLDGWQSVR